MILFENKENAQLIRQYLNQNILFEDCSIALDAFPAYERFDGEFRKVPTDRQSNVLAQLMVGYELHPAMKTILKKYEPSENVEFDSGMDEDLQGVFHLLMLEIARTVMSARLSEERKLRFNKKLFAERIMQLYALRINQKDPEIILVYNHTNGRWADGKIAVSR